jgi:hypothetical protein
VGDGLLVRVSRESGRGFPFFDWESLFFLFLSGGESGIGLGKGWMERGSQSGFILQQSECPVKIVQGIAPNGVLK